MLNIPLRCGKWIFFSKIFILFFTHIEMHHIVFIRYYREVTNLKISDGFCFCQQQRVKTDQKITEGTYVPGREQGLRAPRMGMGLWDSSSTRQ